MQRRVREPSMLIRVREGTNSTSGTTGRGGEERGGEGRGGEGRGGEGRGGEGRGGEGREGRGKKDDLSGLEVSSTCCGSAKSS